MFLSGTNGGCIWYKNPKDVGVMNRLLSTAETQCKIFVVPEAHVPAALERLSFVLLVDDFDDSTC
jgi:hypothetical protein